jgi:predicted NBD/HSP70 family sugar kinase
MSPTRTAKKPSMRGSNASGMRQFNERTVLQAIRHHGAIPKADLARLTQLSTQTVGLIVERLMDEGLLVKGERVRGRVGQPSVPLSLDPDGAYGLGLQVGRRSLEVLIADFDGRMRWHWSTRYDHPDPAVVLPKMAEGLAAAQTAWSDGWDRVVGVGLTAPLSMHQWADLMGDAAGPAIARWEQIDLVQELRQRTPLPVAFAKDTSAACVAELFEGHGREVQNFLYIFVGTFVGGGLVLGGQLMRGPQGNAGAIGSLPMAMAVAAEPKAPPQLLAMASGWQLEQALMAQGHSGLLVGEPAIMAPRYADVTAPWLAQAASGVAMAAASASALLDLDAVVMDGSLDAGLIAALLASTQSAMEHYRFEGMRMPTLLPGTVGAHARALGGALLPLHAQFFPTQDIFLKT